MLPTLSRRPGRDSRHGLRRRARPRRPSLGRAAFGHAALGAVAALLPAWLALAFLWPAPAQAAADPAVRVVDLTNVERQKAGLAPLAPNPDLQRAAQAYAGVLSSGDCFAHTCGPVPDFGQRIAQVGYTGWRSLGENIAGGQRTAEEVVAAWMASPGHRANILNAAFTEIGVGAAAGGRYGVYWAQEFGARPGVAPAVAAAPPVAPAPGGRADQAIPVVAPAPGACVFVLGFANLRGLLPTNAGECVENERFNPANGNAEQRTTGGLFVWRKADNWTAFTDGYWTWVNGPNGVQQRLNGQRFPWESDR